MMRMVSSSPFSSSMRCTWTTSSNAPCCNGMFASHDAILAEHCLGIVENQCRNLERDATVLTLVDPVLFAVPFEPQRYTNCITFTAGKSTIPNASGLAPLVGRDRSHSESLT